MIRITRSSDFEVLAGALVAGVLGERARAGAGIFGTTPVVAPNRTTMQALRMRLADRLGIAAGLEFQSLEDFLSRSVERGREDRRVLGREALQALVLGRLADPELLGEEVYAPVRSYLEEGVGTEGRELRRFQLAATVSRLYVEYAFGRPDWGPAWEADPGECAIPWQQALWRAIFGPRGALAAIECQTGVRWAMLPRFFEERALGELQVPGSAHVLLGPPPSRATWTMLARLGTRTELGIYVLDPAESLEEPASGWVRPDRMLFLAQLAEAGASVENRFPPEPAGGETLLAAVPGDLMTGGSSARGLDPSGDESFRIVACPGIQREVEAIAGRIWELVREDESERPVRFDEIAVLLCGRRVEEYQAQIRSVFRSLYRIPFTLSGIPAATESHLLDAIEHLLLLPFGSWTREEFLALLTHPAVVGRFPEADAHEWTGWCEDLSVLYGADRSDLEGTYVEKDLYTWDQGVRRLALGVLRSDPIVMGEDRYLPRSVAEDRIGSAAAFLLLVRSLVADARFCRDAALPLAGWARFLGNLLSTYLAPTSEDDERLLDRCRERIARLVELDLEGTEVSYRIAYEFARARLEDLRTSRGVRYPEGVVVATPEAVRPLAFRIVFLAGMGEGEFPGGERADALDLRRRHPSPWDVSPRDRDRDLFIEILRSTRDRVQASYVGRDDVTGDELRPSALLSDALELLPKDRRLVVVEERPRRRYQEPPDRIVPPEARREARALRLRRVLAEAGWDEDPRAALERLPSGSRREVAEVLALRELPEPASSILPPGRPAVSIAQLRRFLECPLQGSAAYHLRLAVEEEDALSVADEPFADTLLDRTILLRSILREARLLGSGAEREALLRQAAERYELAGKWPTGVFGRLALDSANRLLETWIANLESRGVGRDRELVVLRFGSAAERAVVDEALDPLVIEVERAGRREEVEIRGTTQFHAPDRPASIVLAHTQAAYYRHLLRGFLDAVCLAAAGRCAGRPYEVLVATALPGRLDARRYAPLSREEASAWLATVVGELLSGVHAYFFPIEVLDQPNGRWRARASWLRTSREPNDSSRHGPVRHADDYPLPEDEDELSRLVERRYGLLRRGVPS